MNEQLDLFTWAENRPTARVIDATPRIHDRVQKFCLALILSGKFTPIEAEILRFERKRGAA